MTIAQVIMSQSDSTSLPESEFPQGILIEAEELPSTPQELQHFEASVPPLDQLSLTDQVKQLLSRLAARDNYLNHQLPLMCREISFLRTEVDSLKEAKENLQYALEARDEVLASICSEEELQDFALPVALHGSEQNCLPVQTPIENSKTHAIKSLHLASQLLYITSQCQVQQEIIEKLEQELYQSQKTVEKYAALNQQLQDAIQKTQHQLSTQDQKIKHAKTQAQDRECDLISWKMRAEFLEAMQSTDLDKVQSKHHNPNT